MLSLLAHYLYITDRWTEGVDPLLDLLLLKGRVFQVTGLNILGRIGADIFCNFFFVEKHKMLCILKGIRHFAFKNT